MAYCDTPALSRPLRYTRKLGRLIGCAAWVIPFVSLVRGGAAAVQKLLLIRNHIRKWRIERAGTGQGQGSQAAPPRLKVSCFRVQCCRLARPTPASWHIAIIPRLAAR